MANRKTVISPDFDKQFDELYHYILKESPQNAKKVCPRASKIHESY